MLQRRDVHILPMDLGLAVGRFAGRFAKGSDGPDGPDVNWKVVQQVQQTLKYDP